jgi:hypothetical protein
VLSGGGQPDLWAAAAWTSELHAELRASVRIRRTQALVARAITAAGGGGGSRDILTGTVRGEAAAWSLWAAGEAGGERTDAASRTLYIGGGGLAVTEGDVRAIVEAATVLRGATKALLRSVSVSRGWAFAEMVSAVEVSPHQDELCQLLCLSLFPLAPSFTPLYLFRLPPSSPTLLNKQQSKMEDTG